MYFDITYLIIVVPCLIIALIASANVKHTFNKYSKQICNKGITGAEAARRILHANGVYNVQINRIGGSLSDHYDPRTNSISLSESVYDNTSAAAIGVACHEAGHAIQYAQNYGPIKLRAAIIPVTNIGSKLAMPLILIGILLYSMEQASTIFIDIAEENCRSFRYITTRRTYFFSTSVEFCTVMD